MAFLDKAGLTTLWGKVKALVSKAQTDATAAATTAAGNFTVNGKKLSTNPTLTKTDVGLASVTNDAQVKRSEMGKASGVATLDANGHVPSAQLPSYVDDIESYDTFDDFGTGDDGKIYVAKDTNKVYRWSGEGYVEISASLALGTTAQTAFPGDRGLKAETDAANAVKAANEAKSQAGSAATAANTATETADAAKTAADAAKTAADAAKALTDTLPGSLITDQTMTTEADGITLNSPSYLRQENGSYVKGTPVTNKLPLATAKKAGLMDPAEKTKLAGLANATALTTAEIDEVCV